jgi:hypothetical protein
VPPQQQLVQLDSYKQIFSAEIDQLLSVRLLPCLDSAGSTCAGDGDKFLTRISFSTPGHSDGNVISDTVVLVTEVEAVASCNLSVATLQHPTPLAPDAKYLGVTVAALDVDSLPIVFSLPKLTVLWDDVSIPMRRTTENFFVATIDQSRRDEGVHSVRVVLEDGWNAQLGTYATCELLHREVVVEAKFNTVWIFVGSVCACAMFVGVLAYWVNKRKKKLGGIILSVLTETMRLALTLCLETGDLATDVRCPPLRKQYPDDSCFSEGCKSHLTHLQIYTTCQVVFTDGVITSSATTYRALYIVFGSLSVVISALSVGVRVRHAWWVRQSLAKVINEGDLDEAGESSNADIKARLTWELEKTTRDLYSSAMTLACALLEGSKVPTDSSACCNTEQQRATSARNAPTTFANHFRRGWFVLG